MTTWNQLRAPFAALVAAALLAPSGCSTSAQPLPNDTAHDTTAVAVESSLSALVQKDTRLHAMFARPAPEDDWHEEADGFSSVGLRGAAEKRWSDLGAHLPRSAMGAFDFGVSVFPASRLSFRGREARDVPGELTNGHVVYRQAYGPSVDLVAAATHSAGELALYLRDGEAPTSFAWDVTLPTGITRVRRDETGSLHFEDARGDTKLRMPAAYAIDARGTKRAADLTWNAGAHRLDVHLDTVALTFPVVLDPSIETGTWEYWASPTRRDGQAMVYDAARGRTMVFGGYDSGPFADWWLWDGNAWTSGTSAVAPAARSSHMMAFDAAHSQVVLFGGEGAGPGELADTWTFDGTTWKQQTPATSPPGRHYGAMAYDAVRKNVVLFGGLAGTLDLADTWIWDGTNWTQAMPAASPKARSRHALAFDAARGNTVLFSGVDDSSTTSRDGWTRYPDTWTWDGTNWTQAAPAKSPSGREYVTLSYDATSSQVLLWGGVAQPGGAMTDTWGWNGTTWTQIVTPQSPTGRYWPTIAADARGRTILFGGWLSNNLNDTWIFNGTTWEQWGVEPGYRDGQLTVYDSLHHTIVLFGGYGANGDSNDTWTYDGIGWTQKSPAAPLPVARADHQMAFDAARGVTVLFGGADANQLSLSDTWTFDGTNWTQQHPTKSPPARFGGAMGFDPIRKKTILFGGDSDDSLPAFEAVLGDTWFWDGTSWSTPTTTPSPSPSARLGTAMAFDTAHGVSLLFGGYGAAGVPTDLWSFDGTTWASLTSTTPSPPGREYHVLDYDSARQRLVMYGGRTGGNTLHDTWSWNGAAWSNESTSYYPPGAGFASMTYDPIRSRMVLFGGDDAVYLYGDTWLYSTSGGGCTLDSQCDTGHCTDGVCCAVASCGTCEACNTAHPGTCQAVISAPDKDSCSGSCDPKGACKLGPGQMCTSATQCASGFCADGVCCNSACGGACQACTAALQGTTGTDGTCGNVGTGQDPHDDCEDEGTLLCGRDGSCNGAGACQLYKPGTSCGTSSCQGNDAVGMICDGLGGCMSSNTMGVDCGAYACDVAVGGCVGTCTIDDQCASGNYCAKGTCMARGALGSACTGTDASACPVGAACSDGVCCNTKCDGQCESCDEVGTVGTCILATGAPRGSRAACAASSKGTSGDVCATSICDGVTPDSCTGFVGPDTPCRTASCSDAVSTLAASCSGSGVCPSLVTLPCAPYACAGTICATSCTSDSDCDLRYRCDTGSRVCVARQGSSCDGDHTVASETGGRTDCTPYKCAGSSCLSACQSIEQCTAGNVCDANGLCAPPVTPEMASGCAVAGERAERDDARGGAFLLTGIAIVMLRRRRRRES